ncbi:MAG: ABC transporter ATP-binding protein [Thermomicrobiales bacterium]
MAELVLEVKGLQTHYKLDQGIVKSVEHVDLDVYRGKTLCIVGESGSGKSVTARSILGLVDAPGRIVGGEILLHSDKEGGETVDLVGLESHGKQIRQIRGKDIAMIFQEPMTSLSPVHTVGNQIEEAVLLHTNVSKREARELAIVALRQVGIPRPETRLDTYPFQLSGGMRQRCMIAMALVCKPRVLIADEPTTALDVTTQAQILRVIRNLQTTFDMGVVFITHDLGIVAEIADDVAIMYLGYVVERGTVREIFHDPKHPYTKALLRSIPRLGATGVDQLESIRGMVPNPFNRPTACPFHTRCDSFMPGKCNTTMPPITRFGNNREVRCLLYGDEGSDSTDLGVEA